MINPFFAGYAEIHYHVWKIFPKYFMKEPEIIADLPIRAVKFGKGEIPLVLIVKDADQFPVTINKLEIEISASETLQHTIPLELEINQPWFSQLYQINLDKLPADQNLSIKVFINYTCCGKQKRVLNDNYFCLKTKPFSCYYSSSPLPYPKDWFAGDPHYHSNFTSDQVEFGADLPATAKMARVMGLHWFFATDHSYDLDDYFDNYLRIDPKLEKWVELHKQVKEMDGEDGIRVIAGEEVSIGNTRGENVHMLAVNHTEFIPGYGDSGEEWFKNKPQHFITEIPAFQNEANLFVAAHCFEQSPLSQRLTLRRGTWLLNDFLKSEIDFLQIVNADDRLMITDSINRWKNYLLDGHRFKIMAGNDAHGNFNSMRQIKIPYLTLFQTRKQVFGNFHTVFKHHENDPIKGIKSGCVIISNGPFIGFELKTETEAYQIGQEFNSTKAILNYQTGTTLEFGEISRVNLFIGDIESRKEIKISNPENGIELDLPQNGYVRMSLTTNKLGLAYTNPVWVKR